MAPADQVAPRSQGLRSLGLRILSSLVLAPIAIAAVWFGSPWLQLLTAAAGAAMGWEWARLCRMSPDPAGRGGSGGLGPSGLALIGALPLAVAAAATLGAAPALVLSALAAAGVFAMARSERGVDPGWLAVGLLWIAVPCVLLLWLSEPDVGGQATLLWIFAVVWATDIGAYAIGRQIGGPRLAPRWSPRKTWSGLLGGTALAALAGCGAARLVDAPPLPLVLLSAGLAIVGQFGDLAESAAKRRFGVKDSSGLIPGHGGLLDRLDGLLAVISAVALLTLIGGGSLLAPR